MSRPAQLAPYAIRDTQGRRSPEPPAPTRTPFARDRDRIVHSAAFRRLVYKTQVFVNHEGDLFRTRLTHSLEVAQLGRALARALALNEELAEALALAHDLGHTPFGHAGQDALNACMKPWGGFEHNLQSLRVVDVLEQHYAAFDGLNLCLETRQGLLKHCAPRHARWLEAAEPGGVAARFASGQQASLEAQLVNLADEIAYNAHDVDDGVRSGLIAWDDVLALPLVARYAQEALAEHPHLEAEWRSGVAPAWSALGAAHRPRRWLHETLRRMLSAQVYDVIDSTRAALLQHRPASPQDVALCPPLVAFSADMRERSDALKRFLFQRLYRHPQVNATAERASLIITTLFDAECAADPAGPPPVADTPEALAEAWQPLHPRRRIADRIAGMTDRMATRCFERLTGETAFADSGWGPA
ncbi:deoxyguanosinetriphosphate triphosphohydrolase [Amphibiibacter pelophylacis]|uniref:deoxyguanosinetriphosphate triphosphohydrolase n=1 Tax=Amphibiibacter pelophylacis TaxID=1799477 RepID=UPI003BFA7900